MFLFAVASAFNSLPSLPTPLDFCLNATSSGRPSLTTIYEYQPAFTSALFSFLLCFMGFFFFNYAFHHQPYFTFIYLFVSPSSPIKNVISPSALFCSPLYPQHLEQGIGHIKHLISICFMNKLGSEQAGACFQWICTSWWNSPSALSHSSVTPSMLTSPGGQGPSRLLHIALEEPFPHPGQGSRNA